MKRILIYYPNPHHTVFLESVCEFLVNEGHTVFMLTTCKRGVLQEIVEKMGVRVFTYTPSSSKLLQFFKHWCFFIRFCKTHNIDIVFSHLQFVNLIAVLGQFFISAKVYPTRHHEDDVLISGNNYAMLIDKLVNCLSKKLLVVSNAVKTHLIEKEQVSAKKIEVVPLGYNFALYDTPNLEEVKNIRANMPCQLLLIIIGRHNENKRHIVLLEALNQLKEKDIKLIILDTGPQEKELKKYVKKNNLEQRVIFTGFLTNTMDYLMAADLLVHPSLSEASNQVVKEAGLLKKPVIVCHNVGDFQEYIVDRINGFYVSKNNPVEDLITLISEIYTDKSVLGEMGHRLHLNVIDKFSIKQLHHQYAKLINGE